MYTNDRIIMCFKIDILHLILSNLKQHCSRVNQPASVSGIILVVSYTQQRKLEKQRKNRILGKALCSELFVSFVQTCNVFQEFYSSIHLLCPLFAATYFWDYCISTQSKGLNNVIERVENFVTIFAQLCHNLFSGAFLFSLYHVPAHWLYDSCTVLVFIQLTTKSNHI